MNQDNLAEFTEWLARMSALYRVPLSEDAFELYWDTLKPFEWKAVKIAFRKHLLDPDKGQYFPKPADVVRYIEGNAETQALRAWSKVEDAIRRVGGYASVVFDDPIIHVVIDHMGGWIRLCQTLLNDLPFRAVEFKKHYVGYVNHSLPRHPNQLLGLEAQRNGMDGYTAKPPLLIGDPKRAFAVLQNGGEKSLHVSELIVPSLLEKQGHERE